MEQSTIDPEMILGATSSVLQTILAERPQALVAAMGADARLMAVPDSVALGAHRTFERSTAVDLLVGADQVAVHDAWVRAQSEPLVHVVVHLAGDPERAVDLFYVDARDDHGVHVLILDGSDVSAVQDSIEVVEGRRQLVGQMARDAVGVILSADDATRAILGWSEEQLVGRRSVDLLHPDDTDRAIEGWMAMRAGAGSGRTQVRLRHATGRYVWLEITNENQLDDPEHPCVLSELVDISSEMAKLEALHDRERHLQRLAEALPIGVCHLRGDKEVVYANDPLLELFGPVSHVDALVGAVVDAERELVRAALDEALAGRSVDLEVGFVRGSEQRRCELTLRPIADDEGRHDGVIVCAADVTDRARLRAELEHRATHDPLSGCLNRAATLAVLEEFLLEGGVTVAYLDLDCLKTVNDTLGHPAGDELLRTVAARLRRVTRQEDRLGRIGGDEFVVVCPHGDHPLDAAVLVRRLDEAVRGPVTFANEVIELQASVGAAASTDGERGEALLSRADRAMYEAKRRRRETRGS